MPPDEEQTEQFGATLPGVAAPSRRASAGAPGGGGPDEPAPDEAAPGRAAPYGAGPAADPQASTLSMRPDAAAPPAPVAKVGRELGAVRLLREIGRGSTGAVYLGHHTVLGRDVAVKFLIDVRCSPDDPVGLKRFLDEARAAAAVRHPHLTQIYHADVDDADGTPYLVLEYVRGPTLKQLLDQAGPLDLATAVAVVSDAASAVHELHARGLIHRDIKPSNILLDGDGHVFVTDFGLAVRQSNGPAGAGGAASGQSTDFAGTPAYMAPEMFDGRLSPRSDVYALGVVTFQLLTGAVPFSGPFLSLRDRHLSEPLPTEPLRSRGVRPEVVEVIERCTNKQPMFRYKTPADMARALKKASGCAEVELARARQRVCECLGGRRPFAAAAPAGAPAASAATTAEDERPSSTSYPEMLARFATVRRERRAQNPEDARENAAEGWLRGPGGDPPGFPAATHLPAAATAQATVATVTPKGDPAVVPGPVLAVSLLGILYASLLAAWAFGEASGWVARAVQSLGPVDGPFSLSAWRVGVGASSIVLAVTLAMAGAGCFGMRPWARKLMVGYAWADLALQLLVMLSVFAWAGPVAVNAMASRGVALPPADQASLDMNVYRAWVVRGLTLSVFPSLALAVMTRRQVRGSFLSPFRPMTEEAGPLQAAPVPAGPAQVSSPPEGAAATR